MADPSEDELLDVEAVGAVAAEVGAEGEPLMGQVVVEQAGAGPGGPARGTQRRGETQAEAATRFGVTQPSYSRWELGQTSSSVQHLDKIARFLGMAPDDLARLLEGTTDPLDAVRAELTELQRGVAELRSKLERTGDR